MRRSISAVRGRAKLPWWGDLLLLLLVEAGTSAGRGMSVGVVEVIAAGAVVAVVVDGP